jgi:hypothetical protein
VREDRVGHERKRDRRSDARARPGSHPSPRPRADAGGQDLQPLAQRGPESLFRVSARCRTSGLPLRFSSGRIADRPLQPVAGHQVSIHVGLPDA